MKYVMCALLVWTIKLGFCQSDSLLKSMALHLSREMDKSLVRGRNEELFFSKDSMGHIVFQGKSDADEPIIEQVIAQYIDSLVAGKTYRAFVYFDLYTSSVYTVVHATVPVFGFPNDDNPLPRPKGGFSRLIDSVYADLARHQAQLDSIPWSEWGIAMDWLIDPTGKLLAVRGSRLTNYLDNSLAIQWEPPIYHGWPITVVLHVLIDKASYVSGNTMYNLSKTGSGRRPLIDLSYLASRKYRDHWVYFNKNKPAANARTAVSFVFNPLTLQLENPVILTGNTREAHDFIVWLKTFSWPVRKFCWPGWPEAARFYFWVDAENSSGR